MNENDKFWFYFALGYSVALIVDFALRLVFKPLPSDPANVVLLSPNGTDEKAETVVKETVENE